MKKIPIPSNINLMWNMGFILSMSMMIQTSTGIMLSTNYINNFNPFKNNMMIYYNNNWGWMMRTIHMNMPSMMFILMIIHIKRNIFFNSFKNKFMWMSGMIILIMMMMTSFMGYVLPWSQMSYWGMMVITNMISIIPYMGNTLLTTLWGNFNINLISLNRMFILHFLMPMMLIMMMIIHINMLHLNLSFNQLGTTNKIDMISLNSYFIIKDMMMMSLFLMMTMNIMFNYPILMNNNDNFIMMNYTTTPSSIEPEWYFMMFYSILRLIDNKLGGLMLTIMSMIIMMMMPKMNMNKFQSSKFYPTKKIIMWTMMMLIMSISIMGFKPMNEIYMNMNKKLIFMYFIMFPIMKISSTKMDKMM